MQATGLSRGGLYHYYSSTHEIMYDLMSDGSKYRDKIIRQTLKVEDKPNIHSLVEVLIDKMLVGNEYTSIYVMFLCELEHDNELKVLYEEIKSKSISSVKKTFSSFGYETLDDEVFEFIINVINGSLLACELLGARPNLTENKEHISQMLELYFKNILSEKDSI